MIGRSIVAVTMLTLVPAFAVADEPGSHPAYKHAMADLRLAEEQIDRRRPEDGAIQNGEEVIRAEVEAAITDLHRNDMLERKMEDLPPPDVSRLPNGRLHATVALLTEAHGDIARPEDDPRARVNQQRALQHIDTALHAAEHIMRDLGRP